MNRRTVLAALTTVTTLTALVDTTAAAQALPVRNVSFEVHQGGQHTLLHLQIDGSRVGGSLNEAALRLDLRGQLRGQRLQGQLFMPGSAVPLAGMEGDLQADQLEVSLHSARGGEPARLLMRRVGAAAPAAPPGGSLDGQLPGRWHQQTTTSSAGGAGGFASFTTLRTLVLSPDGRLQQSLRSVGGGAGWSHRSADEVEFTGRWQTRDGVLWVLADGAAAFQNVGRYQLIDGRLVIEGQGQRQIWRR